MISNRTLKESIALFFTVLISISSCFNVAAQEETIGLLYYDNNTSDGYILFTPEKSTSTYLINNCGELINEWTFSELPGATCYFLENGDLLRAGKDSLEIRDWENNLIWSYATTNNDIRQHHDIEPLPNGNILCVAGIRYTKDEIVALGRDPENTSDIFRMDKIIELEPSGQHEANIVWQWRFEDHLIQEFDDTKPNYGMVIEHPELIDLNYINGNPGDFTHVNAVDYNASLDQIIISPRHLNEIMIIDHSTTTEEAASHSGGNSGVGGDLMWRWGNPAGYQQGTIEDQKLFLQHDSKWVEEGYLDEGKISVFNNGGDLSDVFSFVHLISPVFSNGAYQKEANTFLPNDFEWSWNGIIMGDTVYEPSKSGVISLPNGNLVLCETSKGRVSEITKTGEHLMTYINPVGNIIYSQYDEIDVNANPTFRAEKYPKDHPAFDGRDMSPQGIIEDINSNSEACALLQINEEIEREGVHIKNPVLMNQIQFDHFISNTNIMIFDIQGRLVFEMDSFSGNSINVSLSPAVYLIKMSKDHITQFEKLMVQ